MSKLARVTSEQIQHELSETAATLPIVSLLGKLFTNKKMFDSYDRFGSEGFKLVDHAEHKIMSGSHKSAKGYLFKKYNNDRPGKEQISNYMYRIEGARLLRGFITEHNFRHVVAPRKWLYELPSDFPERYLLVVEKLDLVSESETLRNYDRIGKEQLRELATILYYFRGLNSTAANLPFAEDGRIAFIDTERWHHGKDYLRKVGDRLSGDRRSLAEAIYEELDQQHARPFRSAFKRGSRDEKDKRDKRDEKGKRDEKDKSKRNSDRQRNDFDDEEDTSSSSSSSSSRSSLKVTRCSQCKREQVAIDDDTLKNEEALKQIGWRKFPDGSWQCPSRKSG